MELSVEAVGQWLVEHMDELFRQYPQLKKKLRKILSEELEKKIATKEDIIAVLEEIRNLRQDFNQISARLDIKVSALGARWGLLAESAFRDGMRFIVEKYFGGRVSRWVYRDDEGIVYGRPSEVDVDVLIKDGEHLLIEIRAHVDKADVAELYRKGILYEKVTGVKPRLIMIAPFVRKRSWGLARDLGVEIIEGLPEG